MRQPHKFNIYPSLLDAYANYLASEDTWMRFWGQSDTPSVTLEDFETKQFATLIDKINRVPIPWEDTEKMDRGTAFNNLIDALITGKKSEDTSSLDGHYRASYNRREFEFPKAICAEFYRYFKDAMPQVFCEAILPTKYGDVRLYGYIDELMPAAIHDIKVTGSYEAWKFKNKWQRVVYPYCINAIGGNVSDFEYNILLVIENKDGIYYETKTEYYNYTDADKDRLTAFVEDFIIFLETNKDKITDKKIFNT